MQHEIDIRTNYTENDTVGYLAKLILNGLLAFSTESTHQYKDTEAARRAAREALTGELVEISWIINYSDYVFDLHRDNLFMFADAADGKCALVTYTQFTPSLIMVGESRAAVVRELTQALQAAIADLGGGMSLVTALQMTGMAKMFYFEPWAGWDNTSNYERIVPNVTTLSAAWTASETPIWMLMLLEKSGALSEREVMALILYIITYTPLAGDGTVSDLLVDPICIKAFSVAIQYSLGLVQKQALVEESIVVQSVVNSLASSTSAWFAASAVNYLAHDPILAVRHAAYAVRPKMANVSALTTSDRETLRKQAELLREKYPEADFISDKLIGNSDAT